MKKISFYVTLFFLMALLISACSTQQTPSNSLLGSTAPDFNLDDALGGQTSLSEYEGMPVLLFFHMAVG